MNLGQLFQEFGELKPITTIFKPELDISGGYASDLLSDVLAKSAKGQIWVTVQTHQNVVAIAALKLLSAVIFVDGLEPDFETVRHAELEQICLIGSQLSAFETVGKLFQLLNNEGK